METRKQQRMKQGLTLAHQAVMLADARRLTVQQARMLHRLRHDAEADMKPEPAEDEGDIHVGDVTNHYHAPRDQPASALPAAALMAGIAAAGIALGGLAAIAFTRGGETKSTTTIEQVLEPAEFDVEFRVKDGKLDLGDPKRVP